MTTGDELVFSSNGLSAQTGEQVIRDAKDALTALSGRTAARLENPGTLEGQDRPQTDNGIHQDAEAKGELAAALAEHDSERDDDEVEEAEEAADDREASEDEHADAERVPADGEDERPEADQVDDDSHIAPGPEAAHDTATDESDGPFPPDTEPLTEANEPAADEARSDRDESAVEDRS